MKVLALSDSLAPFHSFWIRIGQYIDSLPWSVHITDDASTINNLREGDRLLMYRFSIRWGDLAARLQQAKQRGVFIISDVDDYIWADISNPSLFRGWSRERLLGYTRALRECHLITCSTESLLLQLSVMFTKQDLQLLPNSSPRMPYLNAVSAPPVRIGWTGAPWTRPNDLAILKPLARWITDRPHELQLVHVGHMDNFPSFAKSLELDHALVETHPLESHKKYLQNLNFHIGLAPLDHTCLTVSKARSKLSNTALLESLGWRPRQAHIRTFAGNGVGPDGYVEIQMTGSNRSNPSFMRKHVVKKVINLRNCANNTPATNLVSTVGEHCFQPADPCARASAAHSRSKWTTSAG